MVEVAVDGMQVLEDGNETITEDYLTFQNTQEFKTISADYDVAHAI